MDKREMTDEEIFTEIVWDKLQRGEYVVADGSVFDFESGDFICNLKIVGTDLKSEFKGVECGTSYL